MLCGLAPRDFPGAALGIGRPMTPTARSIDDVRRWSPLTDTWVPAFKGIWIILFSENDDDLSRLSEAEVFALTTSDL